MKETDLDNPAWEALSSQHAGFALGTDTARRYEPAILPFAGCAAAGDMSSLDPFINTGESIYVIGDDLPLLPESWAIEYELPCAQMLLKEPMNNRPAATNETVDIVPLDQADAVEMYDLINSVQPGYYHANTRLLGSYYGIKKDNRLVAMAGERMRLNGFSELSAICTLPGYTGRGYAQQLRARLCYFHAEQNIVSFLHAALTNQRAIRLYEHLGFVQRRTIVFRKIQKR